MLAIFCRVTILLLKIRRTTVCNKLSFFSFTKNNVERRDYVNNYNLKFGIAAKSIKVVHFIKVEPKYIYEMEEKTERYDAYDDFFMKDRAFLGISIKDSKKIGQQWINYRRI